MLRLSVLFTIWCFTSVASAAIFIEPYVGYDKGTSTITATEVSPTPGTTTTEREVKGVAFGGKMGLAIMSVTLGLDYMHSDVAGEDDTGKLYKFKEDNFGACLGIPLFWSFRLNGTYFFNSKTKYEDETYMGSGHKIGIGFNMFWNLHLNVEKIKIKHDEVRSTDTTKSYSAFSGDEDMTLISLSFPLGE